jgi:hypothetical protein
LDTFSTFTNTSLSFWLEEVGDRRSEVGDGEDIEEEVGKKKKSEARRSDVGVEEELPEGADL